jgi:hypothetical protein
MIELTAEDKELETIEVVITARRGERPPAKTSILVKIQNLEYEPT